MRSSLIFSLPLLLLAAAAPAQRYKAVKDWVGGCDNTLHCMAIGLAAEDAERFASLHFERSGVGADQVTQMRLRVDHPISRDQHWVLRANDAELLQFDDAHLQAADSGEGIDVVIRDADEIAAVFGALRSADTLTLVGDGAAVGTVSLSGASAIMLWIDETQGRLGTTTALVRRGDKSPDAFAPPPPRSPVRIGATELGADELKAVSRAVRSTLEADSCEEPDPDSPLPDAAWQLTDGRTLLQLHCWSGAYNFGSNWYFVRDGKLPTPIALPIPTADGSGRMDSTTELVNASFDPATGVLQAFSKGRGIGDCGSDTRWNWDGRRFQLAHYAMMDDCRGVTADLWPVLWRSVE